LPRNSAGHCGNQIDLYEIGTHLINTWLQPSAGMVILYEPFERLLIALPPLSDAVKTAGTSATRSHRSEDRC
jgi:hypothetical protein